MYKKLIFLLRPLDECFLWTLLAFLLPREFRRRAHSRYLRPCVFPARRIILLLPEIALNVLGTVWTYTDCIQCGNEHFTNTVVESENRDFRYLLAGREKRRATRYFLLPKTQALNTKKKKKNV